MTRVLVFAIGAALPVALGGCAARAAVADKPPGAGATSAKNVPPASTAKAKNVPPAVLARESIVSATPHLPDLVLVKNKGRELVWTGKVCVDTSGSVNQVYAVSGIPGADDKIASDIRSWRFRTQPLPICSVLRFIFAIK